MVTVGAKVPAETRKEMRDIAHEQSTKTETITASDVLRRAIQQFLDNDAENANDSSSSEQA